MTKRDLFYIMSAHNTGSGTDRVLVKPSNMNPNGAWVIPLFGISKDSERVWFFNSFADAQIARDAKRKLLPDYNVWIDHISV